MVFTIVNFSGKTVTAVIFLFKIIVIGSPSLPCSYFTVAQKAVNVPTITAHMDTMNAAALSTDSVIITLIITETGLCSLLLAQGAVLLGEALRHQTRILTLEFEIPSL